MGRFAELTYGINESLENLKEKLIEVANEEFDRADEDTYEEYGNYERECVERLFRESVEEFYASYSPIAYGRRESLYNALSLQLDEYGMVDADPDSYMSLIDESGVGSDRSGGSLFDKVFMQGWHGGATGTDKHGVTKGSPHYRAPIGKWWVWGRPAVQTTSPAKLFQTAYAAAFNGELDREFERIFDKHDKMAQARILARQEELEAALL